VLAWAEGLRSRNRRETFDAAVAALVRVNSAELVRLVGHREPAIARQAARYAGSLAVIAAVGPLARVLDAEAPDARVYAAEALAAIGSPGAMQALEHALDDSERDVRLVAARAIGAGRHRAALARIESAVRNRAARGGSDLTERMAFFDAYGALSGDAGVALLDRLLNGRSMLGRRADADVRACAAMALGRIGTPKASASLERARDERDVLVRNAVGRAMGEIVA
jgi:HEAT repeat protein